MMKILSLAFLILIFACSSKKDIIKTIEQKPALLIISMDGFRYDYFENAATPNFDRMAQQGVKAEGLIPVFPSKTFPNHYSQVTGLYPEHHGIISNKMFDPELNAFFKIGAGSQSTKDGRWFEGEPIWVTAEKQGKVSATFFWPGSDAEIDGVRPTFQMDYNNKIPFGERIESVLEWLSLDVKKRPDLVTLYFESPDLEGHKHGPNSPFVVEAVESMDTYLGKILDGIQDLGLSDHVNILLMSDHGMYETSRDSVIFLDDYIDLEDVSLTEWSPKADIIPKEGKDEQIYQSLLNAHPKLTVYKKSEAPQDLHYSNHRRITPIYAVASLGWSITSHSTFDARPTLFVGGAHGYFPKNKEMWAIFLAKGPAFKKNKSIAPFRNIHLYELMCHLLNITPAANDGDPNLLIDLVLK